MSGDHDGLIAPLVIQRLLRYAKQQPDAPAVCDLIDTWTFAELMGRSAAVARQISGGDESGPIVLLVDRSLDSVAGVLGVLWAGSMLIPVDASEPTDRILEVAGRCGTTRVVDATVQPRSLITGLHVEPITRDTIGLSHWPEPTMRRSDTPMLVLFTSGSTGRAKGVLRTLDDLNELVTLGERSQTLYFPCRTAVFMPINWLGGLNAGVFGLSSGRFTVFVDPTKSSTTDLLARLTRLGVEQLMMPASLLRAISTNRGSGSASSTVRRLVTMGDALYWADVEAAGACFGPDVSVTTMYGATEGNGMFGINTVSTAGPFGDGLLPIGCPAPTLTVRLDFDNVTDEQREAAIGELIFRDAVSAGYLDDAELNERRFGIDPDGVRIWRSGDLVRIDTEGVIHLRGRMDDMVKINGKLVEPAEPERVLRNIPGVVNAVVLPRRLPSGHQQLVAHVEADPHVSDTDLRAALHRELPAHLVPGLFVRHGALPLTDRGKVDRKALAMALPPRRLGATPGQNGDRLVEAVLSIAGLVLDIADIEADESLFDLGMDSLGAIEFAALVNEAGEGHLEANDLVSADTCRLIAERLRAGRPRRTPRSTVFNAAGQNRALFFVAGGGGFPLSYRALAIELGVEQPLVVLEQRGLRSHSCPDRTIASAARRHLREVRRIQPTGPYLLGGHSYGGVVAHHAARLLAESGEEVALVVLDSVRSLRPEDFVPEVIRLRQSPTPVHALKWLKWRAVTARRRTAGLLAPLGSVDRFTVFYQWALHAMTRHHVAPIAVPMLYVCAETGNPHEWDDHPNMSRVHVSGDHLTMLQPPHVSDVAKAMGTFVSGP